MIHTDGKPTIANRRAKLDRKRTSALRKCANIERALNSAESAYPHAGSRLIFAEAARRARVSVADVEAVAMAGFYGQTDEQDYDHNRWNLH